MRRAIEVSIVVLLLAAALAVAERSKVIAPVGPQSILYFVADSQRDLTRMPSHFTRLPDADEVKFGDSLATSILAGRTMTAADSAIESYLVATGARIAPRVHRRLKMRVHYLPERGLFNAFAIPGGHVFVGAGLLQHMTTEDQLAAVLAHEMEHVDHYHCAERLQVEAALRKIPLGFIARIPIEVFQAGYSKDQELEADREGVLLAARAGYSAAGAVDLFEMLERLDGDVQRSARTPQEELAQVTVGALTGYFRSHPLTPERIAQVKTMIARDPALAAKPQRPLEVRHVFLTLQASDLIAAQEFDKGVDLASRVLATNPGYAPALACLAEGEYGRERIAEGRKAHLAAIEKDAAIGGEIQTWVEERATTLAERKQYARELALLDGAPLQRTTNLLRLLTLAHTGIGNIEAARTTATELQRLNPADAAVFADEIEKTATNLLATSDFVQASAMARLAMKLKPSSPALLHIVAAAEFAQAHFAESAKACFAQYDPQSSETVWVQSFGDAAGAARMPEAARDLSTLIASRSPIVLSVAAVKVEVAGLALLSGDESALRELQAWINDGSVSPELLGRLGWCYLRASRPADAMAILKKAETLRPGDQEIQNAIGWTLLEQADPSAAAGQGDAASASMLQNTAQVRHALAQWQAHHSAEAVDLWASATEKRPQWRNAAWRGALYPPRTNALAEQVEAERQRRTAAAATGR